MNPELHPREASPFSIPNVRRFICFRLFFNARFYYPVFTILFLDFGLTLSQFAVLNAVWAATIVLLEVPSGALADTIGRKKLLVASAVLMTLEMAILLAAPRDNLDLLFVLFVVNRILSGTAEASASGADEALAYDSLKAQGQEAQWGRVLETAMRLQAVGFVVTMSLGAVVYDPDWMQWIVTKLGLDFSINRSVTLRLPILLTFLMACLTWITAFGMEEIHPPETHPCPTDQGCVRSVFDAFRTTLQAGRWILQTPFALVVIASGFLFDGLVRMAVTMSSQYYRLIQLPEASFGLIGSAISLMGLFIPKWALRMTQYRSPVYNMVVTAAVILGALTGMALFIPYAGILPAAGLFAAMTLTGFFTSHYLNRITPSIHRATVLSFKGLSFNLSYGTIGILYSLLLSFLRETLQKGEAALTGDALKHAVFKASMLYFPLFFLPALLLLVLWSASILHGTQEHRKRE